MEILYFTAVAIGLYFLSDWILNRVEKSRGARFENRSLIFFAIILLLALLSFQVMQLLLRSSWPD